MVRALFATALVLALASSLPAQDGPFRARDGWIVDAAGRVAIFHGVNASNRSKTPPFEPDLAEGDLALWRRCGFDLVRLLMIWEAIEPEEGRYDDDYLARIESVLDRLREAGVHAILDFHQDLWSRHHFGGDGAPAWAVERLPYEPRRPWFLNYDAPAVQANFDRFWRSERLRESHALAWERVVRRLGSHPAVIGFDLMNEPHPGTARPGEFERDLYVPWLGRLADRLQRIAPDRLVFLEPPVLASTRADLYAGLAGAGRVYAPHYYDPLVETRGRYDAESALAPMPARLAIGLIARRARDAGFPLLFGEWGVIQGHAGADAYVREVAGILDRARAGWCWWAWDHEDGRGFGLAQRDGTLAPAGRWLVRAYPRRTAGVPGRWDSDPEAGTFSMEWTSDPEIRAPTEIVLPPEVFGAQGGRVVASRGVASTSFDAERHVLSVQAEAGRRTCRIEIAAGPR